MFGRPAHALKSAHAQNVTAARRNSTDCRTLTLCDHNCILSAHGMIKRVKPPEPISDNSCNPPLRGFLHHPAEPNRNALVMAHGAGANCRSSLLVAVAEAFAAAGVTVLRCDLPFRQERPFGPPHPGNAARDREGLKRAVEAMRRLVSGKIFLGGHSYGGRQASMLCADEPDLAAALLVLSYPLHPPGKPEQVRTAHFPKLKTAALFVHGTLDPFGTISEMEAALQLIPAETRLLTVDRGGHDLGFKGKSRREELPPEILCAFQDFHGLATQPSP